jgi:E3 ubiquitin-protein ligase HERC4
LTPFFISVQLHFFYAPYQIMLYAWGSNVGAQLGVAKCDRAFSSPQPVKTLEGQQILTVSAGELHTIACTEFGDVFAWGRGKEGQLGHGEGSAPAQQWVPQKVDGLAEETVVNVCCGAFHSLAVTTTGKVGKLPTDCNHNIW